MTTTRSALTALITEPSSLLIRHWNWKSALYSSLLRAVLFFIVNLGAGLPAAWAAMLTELCYRGVTAGFYGSLTQAFRKVEPRWQGTLVALVVLMGISHSVEFVIHWWRGTPHLAASIGASACFTLVSTLFNLHAMRRGVFVTDQDGQTLASDLRRLPSLVFSFVASLIMTAPRLLRP